MKRLRGLVKVSVVFCLVLFGVAESPLPAQSTVNTTWNDATGNWTSASNWSCNCIPNNSSANVFNVAIPTGDVSLDNTSSVTSVTINTLSASATLGITMGESLNVTRDVNVADSGTIQFGPYGNLSTLNVGGNFTNAGDLEFSLTPGVPGAVNVNGAARNSGTINIYHQDSGVLNAGSFTNTGTLNSFGTVAISGALTNDTHGLIELETDASGAGTLTATSFTNLGMLFANPGAVSISRAITNHGSIGVDSA